MNLFELKNYAVTYSPQALMLAPFKKIWDLDLTEDKEIANKELAYVYYMADDRSDYMFELDELARGTQVIKDLDLQGWIEPDYVRDAITYYRSMSETTSTKLLESTRGVIQKISEFLDVIDPNERDKMNKPVFNMNQIVGAVEKMPKLLKALNEVEKEVIKEKEIKGQTGSRDAGVFDDEGI